MLNRIPECAGFNGHACSVCKKWMEDALAELKELRQMKKDFIKIRELSIDILKESNGNS